MWQINCNCAFSHFNAILSCLTATIFDSPPPVSGGPSIHPPTQQYAGHLSAEEMDQQRRQNIAYEYLCHLEESKV